MFRYPRSAALAVVFTALLSSTSLADDWTAVKLRGVVVALFGTEWVKLERNAVIPDDQPIRTLASGRVTFQRGDETVELGPNTQVQIMDRAGRSKYTTVKQHYGRVAVEAEVREVTHFSVQTPFLAAVVKGTRFVVISGEEGARVQVERGAVAVEDSANGSSVVVVAGQEAAAAPGRTMAVSGRGDLPEVTDATGRPLNPRAEEVRNRSNNGVGGGSGAAPGKSGSAPGHAAGSPGKSGSAPGKSGDAPGQSGSPGKSGDAPGRSGSPGSSSGDAPGKSGSAPGQGGGKGNRP